VQSPREVQFHCGTSPLGDEFGTAVDGAVWFADSAKEFDVAPPPPPPPPPPSPPPPPG